jgi:hypothetical protein
MKKKPLENNLNEETILVCDDCQASLIEERGFYVCPECGLVGRKILVNVPLLANNKRLMHKKNRIKIVKGKHTKIKFLLTRERIIEITAKNQIRRLLSHFQISISKLVEEKLFNIFQKVWNSLNSGTKYRDPLKLVPLIFYYYYRDQVLLYRSDIINYSILSRQEFNSFMMQIRNFLPSYSFEAKRMRVLKRLMNITETLDLGMQFYHTSVHILSTFPSLLLTNSDIVAALGATLSKFVLEIDSISVRKITLFFKISMSQLQYHIKKKIIEKRNIAGFSTLVRSKDILAEVVRGSLFKEREEKRITTAYKEFKVNKYLTLKLEKKGTVIYVDKKEFRQCKYLLLNISPQNEYETQKINSIDKLEQYLDKSMETNHSDIFEISFEQEFQAHCSNLQAWEDNGYDTRILHRNLAFPLLKALTRAGDPVAKKVFSEEIVKRFISGTKSVIQFLLIEGYLEFLNKQEFSFLLRRIAEGEAKLDPGSMLMLFNYALDHRFKISEVLVFGGS